MKFSPLLFCSLFLFLGFNLLAVDYDNETYHLEEGKLFWPDTKNISAIYKIAPFVNDGAAPPRILPLLSRLAPISDHLLKARIFIVNQSYLTTLLSSKKFDLALSDDQIILMDSRHGKACHNFLFLLSLASDAQFFGQIEKINGELRIKGSPHVKKAASLLKKFLPALEVKALIPRKRRIFS